MEPTSFETRVQQLNEEIHRFEQKKKKKKKDSSEYLSQL